MEYIVDKKIEDLKLEIEQMEKQLAEAKKAYREMRTKGLRDAMEAKKLADEAVKEEMKALGYPATATHFNWYWRDLT
jgi:phage-related tail protein|tara:strand:- start:1246 stop:1476 length:231 start_codon:yes stop_codon:yes gene_type:complete